MKTILFTISVTIILLRLFRQFKRGATNWFETDILYNEVMWPDNAITLSISLAYQAYFWASYLSIV